MLYTYSGYGLPVSTTATLVFSLAGASVGVALDFSVVNWQTMGRIVSAIFLSIILSGGSAFVAQRVFRVFIRKDAQDHQRVCSHGPWISSFMLVGLAWFMLVKGMKLLNPSDLESWWFYQQFGFIGLLIFQWLLLALFIRLVLLLGGEKDLSISLSCDKSFRDVLHGFCFWSK